MNVGVLNLIPKPGKDSRYIKNLRPITLLNCDYKVIEKMIATRLDPILQHLIHPDQTGFLPNRRIATNIRKMMDIMLYCKRARLRDYPVGPGLLKVF